MAVSGPGNAPPVRERTPTERPQEHEGYRRETPGEQNPGGERPSDFGHRDPDYNHDGSISREESDTYRTDVRSEDSHYATDSKERLAHEKEEGKNYRAELQAHTAENASNNDNKAHKLFGKQSPQTAMPTRPDGPSPS